MKKETDIPEIQEVLKLCRILLRQLKIIDKNGIEENDRKLIFIALEKVKNYIEVILK